MKRIILPTLSSLLMGFTATLQIYAPMAQAQMQASQSQQKLQRIQALARVLSGHGLVYSLYLNPLVEGELQSYANSNNAGALDPKLATIVARMASDLSRGRVLPTAVQDKASIKAKAFAHQTSATNYLNGSISLDQFMANVAPKNRIYIEALTMLKKLSNLKTTGSWGAKPVGLSLVTIKKGTKNPAVISYARSQLTNFGYANNTASTAADAELDAVIRAFQADNAMVSDGIAGQNTWKVLDKSVDQLVTQAILSLDRTRWLPDQNANEYIYVNLARQTFQYFEGEKEIMSFRTINGRTERQTPLLVDVARQVVINPTWTVPRNIFVKDKLPLIRQNPGYIAAMNAKLISDINGSEVDPYSVDWMKDASKLPYTIVQKPGPWNALGRIKFPLTNDFAIYMHDTNERGLFMESERLRSSGCVRLQKPFDVGAKLLQGSGWTAESLMNATELAPVQAEKPTNISLKRSVPVYLAYRTVMPLGEKIVSSNDPYSVDAAMYAVMFSGK
jgi:L,D-transpeptidase YcbB